jgi:hypothetical protein
MRETRINKEDRLYLLSFDLTPPNTHSLSSLLLFLLAGWQVEALSTLCRREEWWVDKILPMAKKFGLL